MRRRLSRPLVAISLSALALTACSGDDEPSAGSDPTSDGATSASAGPAGSPAGSGAPTLPELPSELPSGLPTDLGLNEECAEVEQAFTDAFEAMGSIATDPAGAEGMLGEISAALREAAAASEPAVAAAAEDLADVYDEMAAAPLTQDPEMLERLTAAGTALQELCTG